MYLMSGWMYTYSIYTPISILYIKILYIFCSLKWIRIERTTDLDLAAGFLLALSCLAVAES